MRFASVLGSMISVILLVSSVNSRAQQVLLTDDAQISSAAATTKYGASTTLTINSVDSVLLQFNISDLLPAGTTAAQVSRARLILFPDKVTTSGGFNVYGVTGAWAEDSVTYATKPAISSTLAGSGAAKESFRSAFVGVTDVVQGWITNPSSNHGFEVRGTGATSFVIDSKENIATSHPAVLQIDLIGPTGLTGPAGAPGMKGPTGAMGATGPKGAAGTIALPFHSSAISNNTVFDVNNFGAGNGLQAGGGDATIESVSAGDGITGYGGQATGNSSTATYGGTGIAGTGGGATGALDEGGSGALLQGGSAGLYGGSAGTGLYTIGGYGGGLGLYASAGVGGTLAGQFSGDVEVMGNLSKSSGSFKIDDPLDPANKYLVHSFVESPDMMNVYNGNTITDGSGEAVVTLPDWFEALNRDFRYQLTPIGQFAQAMVGAEIANGKFLIRTDKGNVKVSWQVTGIRQDAWANAHRLPTEVDKSDKEKGHFIHPELFGHKGEPSVIEIAHPQLFRKAATAPPTR